MSKLEEYCKTNRYFSTIKNLDLFLKALLDVYAEEDKILKEFKKANLWLEANPNREKKNYKRFLNNWMSRQSDKTQISNLVRNLSQRF